MIAESTVSIIGAFAGDAVGENTNEFLFEAEE